MKKQTILVRWIFYIFGMLILALGLTLNAKTLLGLAPVASLPYTVAILLDMNFGNIVFVSYLIFVGVELLIAPKGGRALILLQIPISLIFTRLMNGFDALLNVQVASAAVNILLLLTAVVLIGIGAALTMSLKLVPNPVDGIVLALTEYFHKDIGLVKNAFDFSNAFIAFLLGWISGSSFLGVGVGTLICAVGVGRVFAFFKRYLEPWVQKQSGISVDIEDGLQNTPSILNAQIAEIVEIEEE